MPFFYKSGFLSIFTNSYHIICTSPPFRDILIIWAQMFYMFHDSQKVKKLNDRS